MLTGKEVQALPTAQLWAIVRRNLPIGASAQLCLELTWAKAELRRRGCDTVGL